MSDRDDFEDDVPEPGTIGVGMGGSCPVCRAPVDLGQEFCLECGSPIRFTPRQRRQQRGQRTTTTTTAAPPPRRTGFPWIPFLVVLALIGGGLAFALVDGDDSSGSSGKDTTEPALPTIAPSAPDEEPSETETVTLQDCIDDGLDGTQPADPGTSEAPPADPLDGRPLGLDDAGDLGTDEQIPELDADGDGQPDDGGSSGFEDFEEDVPSTDPDAAETVTVDQNEMLCADQGDGSTGGTDAPLDGESGFPDDGGSGTDAGTDPSATGGDWPSGEDGWTVIVAGYPTPERATQRAADLQEDGFSDGGVLFSSDYPSLCPGIHVVFSGTFDSESQASARMRDLQALPDYAGMYVREITTTGSRPTTCVTR